MAKQTQTVTFPNDPDETYAALKTAAEQLRYPIQSADDAARSLCMTTGVNAFSWGETITATVSPGSGGSIVELISEPKLKANVVDMGRGKRALTAVVNALTAVLTGETQSEPPAAAPASAADEIRKLAALRDEGILTEEEFTAKKKQLLGI